MSLKTFIDSTTDIVNKFGSTLPIPYIEKVEIHNLKMDVQTAIYVEIPAEDYAMDEGVIRLIEEAEESINVTIFFLTHNELSKALVEAKKRGVFVRVILDATAATNGYSKHNYLRENGIPLKVESWGGKMHMKAATVDQKHIILGSMNWTAAGGSKNDENTLIVRNDYKNV